MMRTRMCERWNPRHSAPARAALLVLIAAMTAGCGGGDDGDQQAAAQRSSSLVPASVTRADTLADEAAEDLTASGAALETEAAAMPTGGETGESTAAGDLSGDTMRRVEAGSGTGMPARDETATTPPAGYREPTARRDASSLDHGPYCIQVGAFRNRGYAERRRALVESTGRRVELVEVSVDGGTQYRVYVPNIPDLATAYDIASKLHSELGVETLVRKF